MNAMNVFRFALALGLAPIVLGIARRIRITRARVPFLVAFIAIVVGFGLAAGQPLWGTVALRAIRHAAFAVGGFGLAWAAWEARGHVLATAGERR